MHTELHLQRTAREGLATGRLPRMHSQCIWGGYGRGDVCSLCSEPIRSTEVEFEVPESAEGDLPASHRQPCPAPAGALKFHITCHAAWQLECADDETATEPENTD